MRRIVERIVRAPLRRFSAWRAVRQARAASQRRLNAGPIRRVLVVCYGNIYRSPFVGEYLRKHLPSGVEVRTGGFHPVAGRVSPEKFVEMCLRLGIDLSTHRSSIVSRDDLVWADSIILMDRHNWLALAEMGAAQDKLVWLGTLCDSGIEIADPYELDSAAAERVLHEMQRACEELVRRVRLASAGTAAGALNQAAPERTP